MGTVAARVRRRGPACAVACADPELRWGVAHRLAGELQEADPAGLVDLVAGFADLFLAFDPLVTDHATLGDLVPCSAGPPTPGGLGREYLVPVVYGGDHGPDLVGVARDLGIGTEDIVAAQDGAPARRSVRRADDGRPADTSAGAALCATAGPGARGFGGAQRVPVRDLPGLVPRGVAPDRSDPVRLVGPRRETRYRVPAGRPAPVRPGSGRIVGRLGGRSRGAAGTVAGPARRGRSSCVRHCSSSGAGFATVQDLGRTGHASSGISGGGAADGWSARTANVLVAAGYPVVAVATTAAVDLLGQLGPGDRVTFRAREVADAVAELRRRERELTALAERTATVLRHVGLGQLITPSDTARTRADRPRQTRRGRTT